MLFLRFPCNGDVICNSDNSFTPLECLIDLGLDYVLRHFFPNGMRRKRYLPKGELNVVRYVDSSSSWTFQYPHLASIIEKILAPLNFGRISSNVAIKWCSLWIALFKSLGSRHILSLPFGFRRYTRLLTHAVGSFTFAIIPFETISSNSSLMSSFRAIMTRLGGWMTGLTVGSMMIWYLPSNFPIPLKQSGYFKMRSSLFFMTSRVFLIDDWSSFSWFLRSG